jgi:multiple sugar transport system permease protein
MRARFRWSLEEGDLLPVLLMAPGVLLVTFVMVVPLGFGFVLSLCKFRFGSFVLGRDFIGLANYVAFFKDPTALRSVLNTLLFSGGAIAGDCVIGTVAAVLIFQLPRRAAAVVRPIVTIPLLVSSIVVGLVWRYIYDPQGVLYWLLGRLGLTLKDFPGVTAPSTALLSVIIAHWWQVVPFYIIVLTAGLALIPEELYEAAHIDGAGALAAFWRITLPLLTDVYLVVLLISGVDTIKVFDIIYSLTGGGPNNSTMSLSMYAFNRGFVDTELSYAMTVAVVAMVVAFLIFGVPFVRRNLQHAPKSS